MTPIIVGEDPIIRDKNLLKSFAEWLIEGKSRNIYAVDVKSVYLFFFDLWILEALFLSLGMKRKWWSTMFVFLFWMNFSFSSRYSVPPILMALTVNSFTNGEFIFDWFFYCHILIGWREMLEIKNKFKFSREFHDSINISLFIMLNRLVFYS